MKWGKYVQNKYFILKLTHTQQKTVIVTKESSPYFITFTSIQTYVAVGVFDPCTLLQSVKCDHDVWLKSKYFHNFFF